MAERSALNWRGTSLLFDAKITARSHDDLGQIDTGLVVSVGPGLSLTSPRKRLLLGVGVNPSLVSKTEYGREDIGGPFQFTLYAGLSWIFYRGWSVDYRYQHMSNAGIYSQNPGINQHMFGLSYNF
jgi:hypothetical protein